MKIFDQKILIIGFGSIGSRHANILSKLIRFENIYIHTSQIIKKYKKFHKLDSKNLEIFDYIIIANNTNEHFKTLKIVRKYNKFAKILIEKPAFIKKINLLSIVNTSNIFVGYNLRFHPIVVNSLKLIKGKKISFFSAECHSNIEKWRKRNLKYTYSSKKKFGGGVEYELSHEIDLLFLIVGEVKSINKLNKKISNLKSDINDILLAHGKINSNGYFNLSLSLFSQVEKRSFFIAGEDWTLHGNFLKNELIFKKKSGANYHKKFSSFKKDISYMNQHINILEEKYSDLCTLKQYMKILEFIKK